MKNQFSKTISRIKYMLAFIVATTISFSSFAQNPGGGHGGHGGHGGGPGNGGHGGGPNAVPCNADFNAHRDTIVNGIRFNNREGTGAATYSWDFGDGSTSTSSDPTHVYADTGYYYVCLTVTDTVGGGCSETWCDSIHVFTPAPRCNAHFRARRDSVANGVRFFSGRRHHGHLNNPLTTTTYAWDFGDGSTSTDPNPSHTYASAGVYYVCLTVSKTNAGGTCTNTYCDSVDTDSPGHGHHRLAANGISEISDASVSVFPNPMVDNATIRIENTSGNVTFKMIGMTGQVVLTRQLGNGDNTISKENLNEGLYFYTVEDGNVTIAKGKLRVY